MSTDQRTRNKATLTRFQQALSSGDWELISTTIDEVVEPDALIRTPLPIDATGAELLKQLFARLHRAFPDLHVAIEDLIAEVDARIVSTADEYREDFVVSVWRGEEFGTYSEEDSAFDDLDEDEDEDEDDDR